MKSKPAKLLVIIRGLPGSGKSTIARSLVRGKATGIHLENDMYHMKDGVYRFKESQVKHAVSWCKMEALKAMMEGRSPIIVSNTFILNSTMQPYFDMAKENGYEVQVVHTKADFGSIHDVPESVIAGMKSSWEDLIRHS